MYGRTIDTAYIADIADIAAVVAVVAELRHLAGGHLQVLSSRVNFKFLSSRVILDKNLDTNITFI